jgi:hypothetical protein
MVKSIIDSNNPRDTSIQIACRNATSLENLRANIGSLSLGYMLENVRVISLSNISDLKDKILEEIRETDVSINWNMMPSRTTDKEIRLYEGLADTIHVILEKPALGGEISGEYLTRYFEACRVVPEEKLELDTCVNASIDHLFQGIKCSAGIDRIHIWPNGAVTGCPYDSHGLEEVREKDITKSLDIAIKKRGNHPFDHCRIPDAIRKYIGDKNEKSC